jgi:hypothetical protein
MQQEIQGGQALRVACLQGQWQRILTEREVCQGHAYSMQLCYWLASKPEPIPSRLLGIVIKLSISHGFCFVA